MNSHHLQAIISLGTAKSQYKRRHSEMPYLENIPTTPTTLRIRPIHSFAIQQTLELNTIAEEILMVFLTLS